MRARAAYIHSLGTTSILVSSALLMLAMVSALVAFKGWPAADSSSGVQSVPVQQAPARDAAVVRPPPPASVVAAARIASVGRAVGRSSATVGLFKATGRGPATVPLTAEMVPAPTQAGPAAPPPASHSPRSQPGTPPVGATPPQDPSQPVGQVATTIQQLVPPLPLGRGPGSDGVRLPYLPLPLQLPRRSG